MTAQSVFDKTAGSDYGAPQASPKDGASDPIGRINQEGGIQPCEFA